MSTPNPHVEDDLTLTERYLTALADRSGNPDEYQARIKAAESAIFRACGSEAAGWKFIERITADADHDTDIAVSRRQLQAGLDTLGLTITSITAELTRLGENDLYDPEIADKDTDAMTAALAGLRLNLAALRHLTKDAKPELHP